MAAGRFEERAWYRVDHAAVGIAVSCSRTSTAPSPTVSPCTQNPFTEQRPGYFINAQSLAGSVTGAGGNEVRPRLIYTYSGVLRGGTVPLARGSGGRLLGDPDLRSLADALGKLHAHFMRAWSGR